METINKMMNLKGKTIFILLLTALLCITGTLAFFTDTTTAAIEFSISDAVDFDYTLAGNINNSTEATITALGDEVFIAVTETNKEDRDLFSKVTLTADWNGETDISRITFKDTATGNTLTPTVSNGKLTLTLPGNKITANGTLNHRIQVILTGEASGSIISDTLVFHITSDVSAVKDSWAETVGPVELKLHTNLKYPTKLEVQTPPDETYYVPGEDFDPAGMVLKVTYSDNSTALIKYDETEGYMIDKTPDNGVDNYAALSGTEFDIQNVLNLSDVYTYTPQGDYKKGGTAYSDGQVYFTFVYNETTDKYDITFAYNGNTYSYSEDVFMNNYVNNASYTIELNDKPDDVQVGTLPHAAYTENGVTVECDVMITVAAPILKNTYGYNSGNVSILDKTDLLSYLDSDTITEVEFVTNFNGLDKDTMDYADVSDKQNGSVLAWVDGNKLFVGGKTGVYANEQLTGLFSHTFRDGAHYYYDDITSIDVTNLKVIGANDKGYPVTTDMAQVFYGCEALTEIKGLSNWNTASVTEMSGLFGKTALTKITGVSNWDTSKVTSFSSMFYDDYYLEDASELEGWDTSSLTSASSMFEDCTALKTSPIDNWDFSGIDGSYGKSADGMFRGCKNLTELTIPASLGYFDNYFAMDTSSLDTITFLHAPGDTLEIEDAGYVNGAFRVSTSVDESIKYYNTPLKTTLVLPNDTDGSVKDMLYAYDFAYDNRSLPFDVTVAKATGGSVKESTANLTAWSEYALGLSLTPQADTGYKFVNWKITYTDLSGTAHTYVVDEDGLSEYVMPYADITITPVWEKSVFIVTYEANGGEFSDRETTNNVKYTTELADVTKVSKTQNASADGLSFSGNCEAGPLTDVITIPGSDSLEVTITYRTWRVEYSWVCVYDGSVTPSDSNYNSSISGKLGNSTIATKTFTVPGDTVQFYLYNMYTSTSALNNYGYYATVTGVGNVANVSDGEYEQPTKIGYLFKGWYTDVECTNGNEFDVNTTSSDITVYAKWEKIIPIMQSWGSSATTDFHAYKDTITEVEFMQEYNLPDDFDTETGYGPWDVSAAKDESVMAYMIGTKAYICANTGIPQPIIANEDSSYVFSNFSNLSTLTNTNNLDISNANSLESMFSACNILTTLDLSTWDTSNITKMSGMFWGCGLLTELDLNNWNVSNVTDMSYMFRKCTSLRNLDVSNWVTSNVANMSGMFYECTLLSSLDVKDWNTSHVTTMDYMFYRCNSLTTLDVSKWNTSQVTNMGYMFYLCSNLTALDVSNWDTSDVTSMSNLFYECSKLTTLDVSKWDTSNVKYMSSMFENCTALTSLNVTNWDTSNVTNMYRMFTACSSLTTIGDVKNWDTSNVTNMVWMFRLCRNLTTIGDVSNWDVSNLTSMEQMFFACNKLTTLDVSKWDTSNVTKMDDLFSGCTTLTELDVSDWDTSNVITMEEMFGGCYKLTTLDVSKWNTSNVTNMHMLFNNCEALTVLDLSSWDTFNVTDMSYMFQHCLALNTIYIGEGWNIDNVTSSDSMFYNCKELVGGNGTTYDSNYTDKTYAVLDAPGAPGYLTAPTMYTVVFDANGGTGTMHNQKINFGATTALKANTFTRNGYAFNGWSTTPDGALVYADGQEVMNLTSAKSTITLYALWENAVEPIMQNWYSGSSTDFHQYKSTVTEVEFMQEYSLPDGFDTTAGYGPWDVSQAKDESVMAYMVGTKVYICANAGKPANIIANNASNMFYKFTALSSLKNPKFLDVSNVQYFQNVFYDCNSLVSIDLSSWNLSNARDLYYMFTSCDNLTTIGDVSSWDVSNVTDMSYMFSGCINLSELNVSKWKTTNVTDMSNLFNACRSLTKLDVSNWDTSNVTNFSSTFAGCSKLSALDVSRWNTDNVTTISGLFNNCSSLTELNVSGWNTANVSKMGSVFTGCSKLSALDVSRWNTNNVTTMYSMFMNCTNLSELDVSGWNTAKVTNMSQIFTNCKELTVLELDNWNTANVTNMTNMFNNCSKLTTIYVSDKWSTEAVTTSTNMFSSCVSLIGGNGTTYNSSYTDKTYARIDKSGTRGYLTLLKEPVSFSVIFNSTDGTFDNNTTSNIVEYSIDKYGVLSTVDGEYMEPTQDYGIFAGWYTNQACTDGNEFNIESDLINLTSNTTVYAKWDQPDISITYNANGGQFANGQELNKVGYSISEENVTKVSKTSNVYVSSSGTVDHSGSHNRGPLTDVVTIPGAESLAVSITYQTYDPNYNWVAVYDGSVTPSSSNYNSSISGKLGGSAKTTKTFTIEGDTVQFYLYTQYTSMLNYFGYYATVTGLSKSSVSISGAYEKPLNELAFLGWYTNPECTDGNEFNPEKDISSLNSDTTVYAKWGYLDPIMQSWDFSATTDFHQYKSTITEVEFMQEYNLPASVTYGPWDVSAAKDESVMAYMIGTKVYICANAGKTTKVIANTNSNYLFSNFTAVTKIDASNLDTSTVVRMDSMFIGCSMLSEIDLCSWDTSNVTRIEMIFQSCSSLKTIYVDAEWDLNKATMNYQMFTGCTSLVGGNGTTFNSSYTNKTYARIDAPGTPGYFTAKTDTASLLLDLNGGEVVE